MRTLPPVGGVERVEVKKFEDEEEKKEEPLPKIKKTATFKDDPETALAVPSPGGAVEPLPDIPGAAGTEDDSDRFEDF